MSNRCEQLVNRLTGLIALPSTLRTKSGDFRRDRSAASMSASAALSATLYHRPTEELYAPTSHPKLVFPENALPIAPF